MPFVPLNFQLSKSRQLASLMRRSITQGTMTDEGVLSEQAVGDHALDSAEAIVLVNEKIDYKTYSYTATLEVTTGTKRLYLTRSGTFGTFDMFVDTAPSGADLTVSIKKNGSEIGTGTISDGATSGTGQTLTTTSFSSGDYITVDITQVGSSTAGENLYINFRISG